MKEEEESEEIEIEKGEWRKIDKRGREGKTGERRREREEGIHMGRK